jgi:hypothetical protein
MVNRDPAEACKNKKKNNEKTIRRTVGKRKRIASGRHSNKPLDFHTANYSFHSRIDNGILLGYTAIKYIHRVSQDSIYDQTGCEFVWRNTCSSRCRHDVCKKRKRSVNVGTYTRAAVCDTINLPRNASVISMARSVRVYEFCI